MRKKAKFKRHKYTKKDNKIRLKIVKQREAEVREIERGKNRK